MPVNLLSEAVEDYLKAIYGLTIDQERAATNQVAAVLKVAPASATSMLQKMASLDPALVNYQKHHGVSLTPAGRTAALEVIRHHRLLEVFLRKTLGYAWDEVHAEAERLEHYISEDMEARIANVLGNPTVDPHGAPIPTGEFQLPRQSSLLLSELRPMQSATIVQVDDDDASLLKYLGMAGLYPQASIKVLNYSSFDDNLTVQVDDQPQALVLGPKITRRISVSLLVESEA